MSQKSGKVILFSKAHCFTLFAEKALCVFIILHTQDLAQMNVYVNAKDKEIIISFVHICISEISDRSTNKKGNRTEYVV